MLIPHWKHSPGSLITAGTDCLMTSKSTSATNYKDHDISASSGIKNCVTHQRVPVREYAHVFKIFS